MYHLRHHVNHRCLQGIVELIINSDSVYVCRSYYQNVVTSSYSYAWYAALHTLA